MKNIMFRFLNGFCYSIVITMSIELILMLGAGHGVLLPEFAGRFENEVIAFAVQLLLVGVMSGVTSAGTVILEMKRPGLIIQSILFLAVMLAVWIPVACCLWGFHKYIPSMVSCLLGIVGTYGICWGIQYKICSRDVIEINQRLNEKEE